MKRRDETGKAFFILVAAVVIFETLEKPLLWVRLSAQISKCFAVLLSSSAPRSLRIGNGFSKGDLDDGLGVSH